MDGEKGAGGIERYIPYTAILFLAGLVRFYNLMNPYNFPGYSGTLGNNGSDEGVFLMTGKLVSSGYRMYSDVNSQQGPLFSFVIQILEGDPLQVRIMTVMISLFGILGMILLSRASGSSATAIISSMFLALNYVFFKESRHVSFDLYGMVFLIFGFYTLLGYFKNLERSKTDDPGKTWPRTLLLLAASGVLFSFSAMSKLFSIIPVFSVGAYLMVLLLKDRGRPDKSGVQPHHILILMISTLIPTLLLLSIYGFSNTIDGMLLDNLSRPSMSLTDRIQTTGLFLLFCSLPLVLSIISTTREWRDRIVQLMLIWAIPLFLFIIIQSPVWEHYFVLVLPPICYLGGRGFHLLVNDRNGPLEKDLGRSQKNPEIGSRSGISLLIPTAIVFMLVSLCFEAGMVISTDRSLEREIADDVRGLTQDGDLIISGDPIIVVYADRLQPPKATNLAMVRNDPLTDEELIDITVDHNVSLVIFTYELSNYDGYIEFVESYYDFYRAYSRTRGTSEIKGEIPIGFKSFNIFHLRDDIDLGSARNEFLSEGI